MRESDTTINSPQIIDNQNIYYPPGGILIWIIILLELATFGIGLITMVVLSRSEPGLFHHMSYELNTGLGTLNTIILLTSGFFMAMSLHLLKEGKFQKSKNYLLLTLIFGCLFVIIKSFEYYQKLGEGLTLGSNTFVNFYWLLTGFHLIHVLVGIIILASFYPGLHKHPERIAVLDFEASASFWHMCDLIWLILFPVLYLLF